jgi:AcrR family transcriptional regulator
MRSSKPTERVCMDALHHLMQRKMLSHITVQDILDDAGISKATFYRHYKDKDDLFG